VGQDRLDLAAEIYRGIARHAGNTDAHLRGLACGADFDDGLPITGGAENSIGVDAHNRRVGGVELGGVREVPVATVGVFPKDTEPLPGSRAMEFNRRRIDD
jgi:hypothetical protein